MKWTAGVIALGAALLLASCETPSESAAAASALPSPPVAPERPSRAAPADSGRSGSPSTKPSAPATAELPSAAEETVGVESEPSTPVSAPAKGQISKIDIATLFGLQSEGSVLLVDVRPRFFYNIDHIPGAISMPLKSFEEEFPATRSQLDAAVAADKAIVLYCTDENCPDGRATARKLAVEGYSTAVYTGGWKEWKTAGL